MSIVTENQHIQPNPDLKPAKGGWLAISPPGSLLRIAVIGQSKEEAEIRFSAEWAAWMGLVAQSDDSPIEL